MLRRLKGMRIRTRNLALMTVLAVTSLPVGIAAATPDETPPTTVDSTTPPDTSPPDTAPTTTAPPDSAPPGTRPADTAPPDTAPPDTAPPDTAPPDTAPPDTAPPETLPPATVPPGTAPPPTTAPAPPATEAPFNDIPPATDAVAGAEGRAARRTWANGCITHGLRPGDRGRQVVCLQDRLRRFNYPVSRTGTYGMRTADAVNQVKRRAGLRNDSVAGHEALDWIFSRRMRRTRTWGHCITRPVRPGDRGYQVTCLSRRLRALNFPVRVDRRYTVRERYSINHVKRAMGLATNGVAGRSTLDAIFARNRRPTRVWGNCIVDVLRPGSSGYQVKCLQRRLRRLNLLADVDGHYGHRTTIAVNAMRYRAHLGRDGTAGPRALDKIFRAPLPAPIQWGHDETGHQLSVVSVAGPWAPLLPGGSGSGRRIVYSRAHQRVWAVAADGHVIRSWLVSGSLYANEVPGNHYVFSKSRYAYAYTGSGVVLPYMVRYYTTPRGNHIGFHEIPSNSSGPIMSEYELGSPRSAGCTRQARLDAIFLWYWAPVGRKVVVV